MVVVNGAVSMQPVLREVQRANVPLSVRARALLASSKRSPGIDHEIMVKKTVANVASRCPSTRTIVCRRMSVERANVAINSAVQHRSVTQVATHRDRCKHHGATAHLEASDRSYLAAGECNCCE